MRILGLVLGLGGVAVIVLGPGVGVTGGGLFAVGEVLLVALLYAIAPFVIARKLADVPSMGSICLALLIVGIGYLPAGILTTHTVPSVPSVVSLVLLGVLCTAVAFLVFFALIAQVGPLNAPLFTYINPIVALGLGVLIMSEPLGPGLLLGAPIVLVGCWLAATGGRLRSRPVSPEAEDATLTP
ncbi:EamA family transporter [Microbacterium sp. ZW T5_56]|uniref:EamA family transporter n=1 Tax=Microbacterium sp. ZW T5_56 TaxID=3378081 RepID=UPI003852386A